MITKTFGAGGTYATLKDACDSLPTYGETYADDYDIVSAGDSTESAMITIPNSTANMNGHTVTIRSGSVHGGNPTAGHKITSNVAISIAFFGSSSQAGILILQDLNISNNAGAIFSAGASVPGCWTRTASINQCIMRDPNGTKQSIFIQGIPVNVVCCKVTGITLNVNSGPAVTEPSVITIENTSIVSELTVTSFPAIVRNCESPSFTNTANAIGYNNARIAAAMDDSTWKSGSSGNIGNVVAANEFKSTTITDATWLFLKDDAIGTLATSGTTPVYATTDIAGLAIPYAGNYPIGCHVSYVTPPPEFPDMIIDSGVVYKDYGLETETIIGATRGGNKFWIEQGIEDVGYDGRGANVKGAKKILRVQPFIEVNVIEISQDLLLSALPASVVANGATQVTITRALQISLSDYCDNITIVGEIYDKNLPIICMIKNALCVSDLNMEYTDKSEAVLTLKFAGHFDEDNLNEEPWEIRYPREA